MQTQEQINFILSALPERIKSAMEKCVLSGEIFEEIRLRTGMPVSFTKKGKSLFLYRDGSLSPEPDASLIISAEELEDTLLKISDNSVFAHTKEIENGYIAAPGGIRVGVSGDFSPTLAGINSANIRIPRQIIGCADFIFSRFSGGMLLAGPPGSGKTTMLRDLIRQLSKNGTRVSVVDSRREISGGNNIFDLGFNTDVLFLEDKAFGAICALKTMYPQVIAFDEIGTSNELDSIFEAFNAGVDIIATAHAGSLSEIKTRSVTGRLIESGAVKTIVLLSKNIGERPKIYSVEEI